MYTVWFAYCWHRIHNYAVALRKVLSAYAIYIKECKTTITISTFLELFLCCHLISCKIMDIFSIYFRPKRHRWWWWWWWRRNHKHKWPSNAMCIFKFSHWLSNKSTPFESIIWSNELMIIMRGFHIHIGRKMKTQIKK